MYTRLTFPTLIILFSLFLNTATVAQTTAPSAGTINAAAILELLDQNPRNKHTTLQTLQAQWQPGYVPMLLEILRFSRDNNLNQQLLDLLSQKTGQNFATNINQWYRWQWAQPANFHPDYATFKAKLYQQIDPRFASYFDPQRTQSGAAGIRLDEIRWGGVLQDGIPPLRQPHMIRAQDSAARYLQDENIVFGVAVNGDARAYPQRILAWHEMFVDTIGGIEYAGVYCTLCGSVVLYETHVNGQRHQLGTSGFLFRSNKLMYDQATQSLWNSTWGKPVLGPLAGSGIALKQGPVVTTTWGEWRRRHPNTQVLSLDTGHERDYGEGVAYQQYFATHKLMFDVPKTDNRLNNKDEVLALRAVDSEDTLAIDQRYLLKHRIYHDRVGKQELVVLTDDSGANRVFASDGLRFVDYDGDQVTDSNGQRWQVTEAHLTHADGTTLARLPARRAFWFGWYAAYNDTRLIK